MPLPMALDHINLYLLEDTDGWWIIDTGIGFGETQALWQQIFDQELQGKPIKAVLCTHMHPDHVGQAGWICDKWRVPLYMTMAEYLSARTYSKMTADDLSWTSERYYRNAGMDADYFPQMKARFRGFGSVVEKLPGAYRRLEDSDYLNIGGVRWRVLIGRGHSPEHACLYSAALNVLISGDQVIPRITSNVSVSPGEPEGNPLQHWLASPISRSCNGCRRTRWCYRPTIHPFTGCISACAPSYNTMKTTCWHWKRHVLSRAQRWNCCRFCSSANSMSNKWIWPWGNALPTSIT